MSRMRACTLRHGQACRLREGRKEARNKQGRKNDRGNDSYLINKGGLGNPFRPFMARVYPRNAHQITYREKGKRMYEERVP